MLKLYVRSVAFAEAHPIAAGLINFGLSLIMPFEVMGVPTPPLGGVNQAVADLGQVRLLRNILPQWLANFRYGNEFTNFLARFLPGAQTQVSFLNGVRQSKSVLGSRRIDFLWRDIMVEGKTTATSFNREQAEEFLITAQRNNYKLVYVVLENPRDLLQKIQAVQQATGTTNVPVKIISFDQ